MPSTKKSRHSINEILDQPEAWEETIRLVETKAENLRKLADGIDEVIFTGCGSGLNVSWTVAPTFQHLTGIRARAVPSADCVYFPETVFSKVGNTLVVLISRSGDTTETILAGETALSKGMNTLSITCYSHSRLAQMTSETLVLEAANEKAVVTTRSLTSMVLCGQVLTAVVSHKDTYLDQLRSLPEFGDRIIEKYHNLGGEIAENETITKFAFVGSGPYYGLARECQLKIKEMTLLPSDSYPVLEYRHGPKSNIDEHMLVALLMSDSAREAEISFLKEMKDLGGITLVLCDRANPDIESAAHYLVELRSGLPEFARDILYIPPVHFLAYYKSLILGYDPDNPVNLDYAVVLSK